MCQDQPRQATVKVDGSQGLEQRNQDDLVRDEHAEQEKCKDKFTALEFPFGKDISVDGSQNRGDDGCKDGEYNGVYKVGLQQCHSLQKTRSVERDRWMPRPRQADVFGHFQGGHHHHIGRQKVGQCQYSQRTEKQK